MSDSRVRLNKTQIKFLTEMLEIQDPLKAVEKFVEILLEEKLPPKDMGPVINEIIRRMARR